MRYQVRQQEGKWLVWDTLAGDCATRSAAGAVEGLRSMMAGNRTAFRLEGGFLVPVPSSVTVETRPAMFWTQEEAQQWADAWNDMDAWGRPV